MRRRITITAVTVFTVLSLTEAASAYYSPAKGRFLARDPIGEKGGANLYGFVRNTPIRLFDLLGLKDCRCKDKCCTLKNARDLINRHVNGYITSGFARNNAENEIWRGLAAPGGGIILPISKIEAWLDTQSEYLEPGEHSYWAPCVKITCGGEHMSRSAMRSYCIGTDKIGHFFQVGYMLYEVSRSKDDEYAKAFGDWTEGLYKPNFPEGEVDIDKWAQYQKQLDIYNWLTTGYSLFRGFGWTSLAQWERKWGGRWALGDGDHLPANYYIWASTADKAANEGGLEFWKGIRSSKTPPSFDICGAISEAWVE